MPCILSMPSVSVLPAGMDNYLLIAKDNQPTLADEIRHFFQRAACLTVGTGAPHVPLTKAMDGSKSAK